MKPDASAGSERLASADRPHLLILGLGYSARAVARRAIAAGYRVTGTSGDLDKRLDGVTIIPHDGAADALERATHWLIGAPPSDDGDPFLLRHEARMAACRPCWIGYFSTTGLYGDRQGGWVDETSSPAPRSARGLRRLAAELGWRHMAERVGARLDLLRLGGIYGPGRSVFETLRSGTARRVDAPGHMFGRIHRDDIAGATLAAMSAGPVARVLNLVDDLPAESADVLAYGAALLGLPPPPCIGLDQALATMSAMGRSFWMENRKVSSALTQRALGRTWLYPSYREGLKAIFVEEKGGRIINDINDNFSFC